MSLYYMSRSLPRASQRRDLCSCLASLSLNTRSLTSSASRNATPTLHPTTRRDAATGSSPGSPGRTQQQGMPDPSYSNLTPAQRAVRTAERTREKMQERMEQQSGARELGGLADNSLFADEESTQKAKEQGSTKDSLGNLRLSQRNVAQMSLALNPRPNARARWQRKMVIRHIRHKGRLPRLMQIERTERSHLSRSHFFKTSMKKLAPLARQIAGKPIDEAILQMRFSKKKAAVDVRKQLIQARNEAIVMRGMGLSETIDKDVQTSISTSSEESPIITDPAITPALPHETPTKTMKAGTIRDQTDIYVAQAWTNRGPYGREPEPRARGRMNILRPPHTGISILLKEEKTRTREKADKEAKAIRKRVGKNMWTQLPDRPITRQSQYVLW